MTIEGDGVINREFNIFSNSDYTKWQYYIPSPLEFIKIKKTKKLRFNNKEVTITDRGNELLMVDGKVNIGKAVLKNKRRSHSEYYANYFDIVYQREVLICLAILTLQNEIYSYVSD